MCISSSDPKNYYHFYISWNCGRTRCILLQLPLHDDSMIAAEITAQKTACCTHELTPLFRWKIYTGYFAYWNTQSSNFTMFQPVSTLWHRHTLIIIYFDAKSRFLCLSFLLLFLMSMGIFPKRWIKLDIRKLIGFIQIRRHLYGFKWTRDNKTFN